MNELELQKYVTELAIGRVAWAKAVPNGSDSAIRRAADDVAAARRDLAAKTLRLDHLLGHPWRVGFSGDNCDCEYKREDYSDQTDSAVRSDPQCGA